MAAAQGGRPAAAAAEAAAFVPPHQLSQRDEYTLAMLGESPGALARGGKAPRRARTAGGKIPPFERPSAGSTARSWAWRCAALCRAVGSTASGQCRGRRRTTRRLGNALVHTTPAGGALKRDRLRKRTAILKSTGFLELNHTPAPHLHFTTAPMDAAAAGALDAPGRPPLGAGGTPTLARGGLAQALGAGSRTNLASSPPTAML